jgi:hypothetical protein
MSFLETVAGNIPDVEKVMLTCFLSNKNGLEFYRRLGFEKAPHSPEPRKLRFGKMFTPDYMIMSKDLEGTAANAQVGTANGDAVGTGSKVRKKLGGST